MTLPYTTYTAFLTALADMDIAGVVRKYAMGDLPASLNTADLPASWVEVGALGEARPVTFEGGAMFPTLRAIHVVAVQPVARDRYGGPAYLATVGMMDNVTSALRSADLARSKPSWRMALDVRRFGDTPIWCVITEVTAKG